MRKIAFFLPALLGGGAERVFVILANEFAEKGISVDFLLAKKEGPYLKDLSTKVNIIDLNSKRTISSLFPLARYLRKSKPDFIFSTMDHVNIVTILSKIISFSKTRVIIRIAINFSTALRNEKFLNRILLFFGSLFFYRFSALIIAVSVGVKEDLVRLLRIKKDKVVVIYNPLNPQIKFLMAEGVTKKYGHLFLDNFLISMGRLTAQKNFSLLLKAFSLLKNKHQGIKLVILGEGEDRAKLEIMIKKLKLRGRVFLLGFQKNPYPFIKKAKIFILPSNYEGLSNVLIEAMACGTTIISTDCPGGSAEILGNGKYGRLVPVNDAKALAVAISDSLDNLFSPDILRARADDFSLEKIANQYLSAIGFKNFLI